MRHTDGFTLEKAQSAVAKGLTVEQAALEFNASPKRVWFFARKHNLLPAFEDSAVKAGVPMFKPDSVIEGEARAKQKLTGRTAKKAEAGAPAASPRRAASADPEEVDWPYALKLMDRVVQDELAGKPQQLTKREAKVLAIIRAFFTRQVMPPIVDMLKTGKGVTIVTNPAVTPAQVVVELTETLRGIARAVQDSKLDQLTEDEVDLRDMIQVLAGQPTQTTQTVLVHPLVEIVCLLERITGKAEDAEANMFDEKIKKLLREFIRDAGEYDTALTAVIKANERITELQRQVNDLAERLRDRGSHRHQLFGAWTGKAEYDGEARA